jgi:hypothetical protein
MNLLVLVCNKITKLSMEVLSGHISNYLMGDEEYKVIKGTKKTSTTVTCNNLEN